MSRLTDRIELAAFGGGLLYDTLMEQAIDEGSVSHPLVAEAYKYADDYSSATYRLNPKVRFHDGSPITADDVIWTLESLKANNPFLGKYFANVVSAAETAPGEVTFTFDQKGNRELPHIVGDVPVLPKAWWTGKDASGKPRDVASNTLEPILGSGPYAVSAVRPGLSIAVKRVENYWGKDLPLNRGQDNFDEIETQFYQDRNILLEAFKGNQCDIQYESSLEAVGHGL